jgi:hypothetical protein
MKAITVSQMKVFYNAKVRGKAERLSTLFFFQQNILTMENKRKYDDVNINLIDYAHDYIQRNPEYEKCNKTTYNLCVDYIYSGADFSANKRENLVLLLSR